MFKCQKRVLENDFDGHFVHLFCYCDGGKAQTETFELFGVLRIPRPLHYQNPFNVFDDRKFEKTYRFSSIQVHILTDEVRHLISGNDNRGCPIPAEQRMLMFLYFVASDSFERVCANFPQVSTSSACRFIRLVAEALAGL